MKSNRLVVSIFILVLIFVACRKEWIPTEADMANYAWTLYEQGDYIESMKWFKSAIREDKDYKDGYNGLGYCYGKYTKLSLEDDYREEVWLDSSIHFFDIALIKPHNPRMLHNVDHDILAGLTFAHSALKHDSSVVFFGDSLISLLDREVGEKKWAFPHDTTTNYLDVHIIIAMSYFGLGNFDKSIEHVQAARAVVTLPNNAPPHVVNTAIITSYDQLADAIQYLQELLGP